MSARQMTLDLLEAMQADAVTYLSDNDCGADWFVNQMLWHLDGPQQRAAQAALEAEIAHPVAPGTKQLTVQLHDEQKWTVAEQQQFAEFLKRFPNESSQGIISLGDAWMHGKACSAPQEPVNTDLLNELKDLRKAYVSLLESGRSRIIDLGGTCDAVAVMEANDPSLRSASGVIAKAGGAA